MTAIDRAGNRRSATGNDLLIPVDDRDRSLIRFSKGWKRLKRSGRLGPVRGALHPSRRHGQAALPGHPPGADRAPAAQGRQAAGEDRQRQADGQPAGPSRGIAACCSPRSGCAPELHGVRLTAVGGGPVELDAVAVHAVTGRFAALAVAALGLATAASAAGSAEPSASTAKAAPVVEHMVVFRDGSHRAKRAEHPRGAGEDRPPALRVGHRHAAGGAGAGAALAAHRAEGLRLLLAPRARRGGPVRPPHRPRRQPGHRRLGLQGGPQAGHGRGRRPERAVRARAGCAGASA